MTTTRRRILAGATLALAALGCVACDPPAPIPAPAQTVSGSAGPVDPMDPACTQTLAVRAAAELMPCNLYPTAPVDGVVTIGDSITWQVAMAGRLEQPFYGMMGYAATEWVAYSRQLPPDTCRVVLGGTNDASQSRNDGGSRGWNTADEDAWRNLLATGPGVIVLPWLLPPASEIHRADIDRARAFITAEATAAGWAVTDWRPYAETPGVLEPDGIHLAHGTASMFDLPDTAAGARNDVIDAAVGLCPTAGTTTTTVGGPVAPITDGAVIPGQR